ncbi:MAG: GGDEF domain-containing protein [Lysobacter sp.]
MALNIDLLFIMVDLDYFKRVNDEHGHPAGDKVLQQMGMILKEATRDTDTVVRWGGEELLIVGRQVCRNDFTILAERIRSYVAEWVFDLGDGKTIRMTCSLGFMLYPFVPKLPTALGWERVVALADQCLYVAKRSGRNAWGGLCPSEDSDDTVAATAHPGNIADLIEDGTLIVQSSLPLGAVNDWRALLLPD